MQIFAPVRPLDARSLGGPTLEVDVAAGAQIVHEGHFLGTFFVIRRGTAELWQAGRHVRTLRSGECFGEIDQVPSAPQRYSVVAGPDLRVLTFSSMGVSRLCASVPHLRERLEALLPHEELAAV